MFVLILIVVEDGLVQELKVGERVTITRLNPYCSGRWSRTSDEFDGFERIVES